MKLLLLFCIVAPAFCQASFTVASVKTSAAQEGKLPRIVIDPGRVDLTNVSLKTLITRAYSVKDYQVTGPEWIGADRFTVVATMPPETPPAAVWDMLQTLLTERFQMKVRRTTQELPVYALTVGKGGPKLSNSTGGDLTVTYSQGALRGKNASMTNIVNLLGGVLDRPVLDATELGGSYDFALEFAPDPSLGRAMAKMSAELAQTGREASGPSIFTAIQQLGLKLEPRKAPVEMIVIESAARVPTEN